MRDDPNESSAVYLLTSDDEYAVCGTNFLPNQLLCRKYLATKFFFVEETFDHVPGNEKDQVSPICRYRTNLGDFRHRRTMILKVYVNGHKTGENRGKELNNVWMNFSPTWPAVRYFEPWVEWGGQMGNASVMLIKKLKFDIILWVSLLQRIFMMPSSSSKSVTIAVWASYYFLKQNSKNPQVRTCIFQS